MPRAFALAGATTFGDRFAREQANLERANQPSRILPVDRLRRIRIERLETNEQFARAEMTEPFAQFAIRRRQRRESVSQRLDVKTAAADDDRVFAARLNLRNRIEREPAEFFRVHFFRQRNRADKWCGTFASVARSGLAVSKSSPR